MIDWLTYLGCFALLCCAYWVVSGLKVNLGGCWWKRWWVRKLYRQQGGDGLPVTDAHWQRHRTARMRRGITWPAVGSFLLFLSPAQESLIPRTFLTPSPPSLTIMQIPQHPKHRSRSSNATCRNSWLPENRALRRLQTGSGIDQNQAERMMNTSLLPNLQYPW